MHIIYALDYFLRDDVDFWSNKRDETGSGGRYDIFHTWMFLNIKEYLYPSVKRGVIVIHWATSLSLIRIFQCNPTLIWYVATEPTAIIICVTQNQSM